MRGKYLFSFLLLAPVVAHAQAFKCIDQSGHVTYSQAPCADSSGTTTELNIKMPSPPNLPPIRPGNERARLEAAADWVIKRYPPLGKNQQAAEETAMLRDRYISAGEDSADALIRAAKEVGPKYLSQDAIDRADAYSDEVRKTLGAGRGVVIVEDSNAAARANRKDSITNPKKATATISRDAPAPESEGVIDTSSGQFMPKVAGGIVSPTTGKFYPKVAGGYIDNETGRFIPSP